MEDSYLFLHIYQKTRDYSAIGIYSREQLSDICDECVSRDKVPYGYVNDPKAEYIEHVDDLSYMFDDPSNGKMLDKITPLCIEGRKYSFDECMIQRFPVGIRNFFLSYNREA